MSNGSKVMDGLSDSSVAPLPAQPAEASFSLPIGDWEKSRKSQARVSPRACPNCAPSGGRSPGALKEYRAARKFDPQNADFKKDYERLLKKM
jgi:hypothetical protein